MYDVYVSQNQLEKALECFERSLQLREQLLCESDTPQNRRDVANALINIGNLYIFKNQYDKAFEYFAYAMSFPEALPDVSYAILSPNGLKNREDAFSFSDFMNQIRLFHQQVVQPFLEKQITLHIGKKEQCVIAQQTWTPFLWQQFRQQIWFILTIQQQTDLLNHFPQTEIIQNALMGQAVTTRPTLGFIIAATQWAEQASLLYRFIDFAWWTKNATPQDQAPEQLELLSRDQHDWGIIWLDLSLPGVLKNNPQVSAELSCAVERGLAIAINLKIEEKQQIIKEYAQLSGEQIEAFLTILIEEQQKFALLAPGHQSQLAAMAQQVRQEWEAMVKNV